MSRRVGDPGLFGPTSISWRIDREVIVLAGGSCALLMQAAHPAVAAGVAQHSSYREDPFGRLLRTLTSSFAVVFGSTSVAHRTLARVNAIHAAVRGSIPETGARYSALDPQALLWVHATLVDTALRLYERHVEPLTEEERDRYHHECSPIATALGVPESLVPPSVPELRGWMDLMVASGDVRVTPTAREIAAKILYPTRVLPAPVWDAAHFISMATLRPDLREQYGIEWGAGRERLARVLAAASRRALPLVPPALRYVPQARRAERRARGEP